MKQDFSVNYLKTIIHQSYTAESLWIQPEFDAYLIHICFLIIQLLMK